MYILHIRLLNILFFFNDTATTEIYTLSLHDALPIFPLLEFIEISHNFEIIPATRIMQITKEERIIYKKRIPEFEKDRKSTRLNSSHANISYAVFCLKKKKKYRIINKVISS